MNSTRDKAISNEKEENYLRNIQILEEKNKMMDDRV